MSLDVYLEGAEPVPSGSGIFVREGGSMRQISREEWDTRFPGREPVVVESDDECRRYYNGNITHNVGPMAREAGLYEYLWRPDEVGIGKAAELIGPLTDGLTRLRSNPPRFKRLNPKNGWGSYEGLVRFVEEYLDACTENQDANVRVWR